jgi:hypothetical protein
MIRIEGYSDDTVSVSGDVDDDIDTCASDGVHVLVEVGGIALVRCWYNEPWNTAGTWTIGVQQAQEDTPIPWPMRVVPGGRGYSVALEIDCPTGTAVAMSKVRP